ncbi:hypothetical protein [Lentilactobacillus hilgardii]|jgi:type III secretory pathway component EscS|nr:hypothetical protein [Lentilactobacillus hilgardii]EEI71006.1 hypothetical protein HMPREF0496_1740 [Lentilactobacillus hilgardii ATCC 27305]
MSKGTFYQGDALFVVLTFIIDIAIIAAVIYFGIKLFRAITNRNKK